MTISIDGSTPCSSARIGAVPLEGPQGVDLTARAVQRQHELRPPPLSQRFLLDGCAQVGQHALMVAQLQPALEEILLGTGAAFAEPGDLPGADRSVDQIGQWLPPPQLQGPPELGHGGARVPGGQQRASTFGSPLESEGVDQVLRADQSVPLRCGLYAAAPSWLRSVEM